MHTIIHVLKPGCNAGRKGSQYLSRQLSSHLRDFPPCHSVLWVPGGEACMAGQLYRIYHDGSALRRRLQSSKRSCRGGVPRIGPPPPFTMKAVILGRNEPGRRGRSKQVSSRALPRPLRMCTVGHRTPSLCVVTSHTLTAGSVPSRMMDRIQRVDGR